MKAATFSGHTDVSLVLILVDLAGHMIISRAATIVFLDSLYVHLDKSLMVQQISQLHRF